MASVVDSNEVQNFGKTIDDLPDEVIEFILGFLPPYKDLQDCMCVSKRWYGLTKNVMRKTANSLYRAISEFNIRWRNITPVDMAPSITKRFSHAACVHENSMYIFGGCTTNSTAFNDLWRFDLSRRQWIRPLTIGAYPTPKAYASMICYKDSLILFGGWTYPSASQYYQDWTMFNDIHFYNITTNRWILKNSTNNPPPMAGHSAMIRDDCMIVLGGLYKPTIQSQIICSNDVWVLDLKTMDWRRQPTGDPKPSPRYGQSLITLNDNSLMILGGVQALHNRCVYNDCWVLKMQGPVWTWYELTIKNKEWSAANIWCNPAIKVGDKVVSLSRNQNGGKHPVTSAVRMATAERRATLQGRSLLQRVEYNMRRPLDKDNNVNGRRGVLPHRRTCSADTVSSGNDRADVKNEEPKAGPSRVNADLDKLTSRLRENNDNQVAGSSKTAQETSNNFDKNDNKNVPGGSENRPSDNSVNLDNKLLPKRPIMASGPGNKIIPSGLKIVRQLNESDKFRKMAAFACDSPYSPPEHDLINQRRISHEYRNREERDVQDNVPVVPPVIKKLKRNTLAIHVLDISNVINGNTYSSVSWLCPKQGEVSGAPEEFIMYSLVRGKGELIMFGGVHNDVNLSSNYTSSPQYSNSLHFITPPRDII